MKLSYRGVNYEFNPSSLEFTEGEINGKYRGANRKPLYPRHICVPQPVVNLKYRGVDYSTGDPLDVEASLLRKRYANTITIPEQTVTNRQQILNELTDIHAANIRRNLEHRLEVAKAKGDRQLICLLEAEAKQMP